MIFTEFGMYKVNSWARILLHTPTSQKLIYNGLAMACRGHSQKLHPWPRGMTSWAFKFDPTITWISPKTFCWRFSKWWYGRSFTLADPSCKFPNGICQFSGAANPGPCSNAGGILDDQEINDIISKNNLQPTWDKTAGVKWVCISLPTWFGTLKF